jgi:hypothetical protein
MTALPLSAPAPGYRHRSAFAGVDVCQAAGLRVEDGAPRPVFDADRWELSGLADAHRMVHEHELIWDFTQIVNPAWRTVAKEILLALLAPGHEAVLECSHALRTARSPRTCFTYLGCFTELFNWLTDRGVQSLTEVDQRLCELYLEERSWSAPRPGRERRRLAAYSTVGHIKILQHICWYGELLSADGYRDGFTPWPGKTAAQIVGYKRSKANTTPEVPDETLQPLLATCLYLVNDVGPHLADLLETVRADKARIVRRNVRQEDLPVLRELLAGMRERGEALPAVADNQLLKRSTLGEDGPLTRLGWNALANMVGAERFDDPMRRMLIPEMTALAGQLGFAGPLARDAALINRWNEDRPIPWTRPLAEGDVHFMADHVVSAALVATCALSGMRTSELMEIDAGARLPAAVTPGGGRRYRLASRLIKHRSFGGVPDEWVVIEQVDTAVALAERLTARPHGEALFGYIDVSARIRKLRAWLEKTGNRDLWGLPPIPAGTINARMLRRTLALAIAERPGGLLAAKVALKHISVVTTEGYARPGGSQRLFHAEIEEAEESHHVQLTVEAFREFQAGQMPAGPGARSLIEAFNHVDAALKEHARTEAKALAGDRHLENLLRKQAAALHVGAANFCWFTDPAKALCLRMTGATDADRPLVGMCDSARCPQATHHGRHRPVWVGTAQTLTAFLDNPRIAKGEKARLSAERERARRVVAEIDAVTTAPETGR